MIRKFVGEKRRWKRYKARTARLAAPYGPAVEALERYLMYYAAITKGDVLMSMLEDLADLFEQGAADGTSIRALVGPDPVEFAEEFVQNYSEAQWISKERTRLTKAIDLLAAQES
ncbi:DUF1048 domain-containing protein [Nocardioides limicola]|uniref:DUF1048 domain-containing protein n=1 Tax=Nocardioides limicola TaxID=2803368 RepID=UPI00193B3E66|nr:DUF1048 domain-containing protein [Nocardioides sp. DJM-14]